MALTLTGAPKPRRVTLLSDGSALKHDYHGQTLNIQLPSGKRSGLVAVVEVNLPPPAQPGVQAGAR
jgi:hypothetical protein